MSFDSFFRDMTGHDQPHQWQTELASDGNCANRLIRIPTGFGKTDGVLAAWLWHRLKRRDERWPRRLVWCLPMRVLVEQTADEARRLLQSMNLLWIDGDHSGKVAVHILMGGADPGEWHLHPEQDAVLIGTQDMLLSRAMNRGYAAPRARWPMEFGLLNQDCLWVMDEVQLMDVGLATSAQLQTFRGEYDSIGSGKRPCRTWWMSATLQRDWLSFSVDARDMALALPETSIPEASRRGHLWEDVAKPCSRESASDEKAIAGTVAEKHLGTKRPGSCLTLAIFNTVSRAVKVAQVLRQRKERGEKELAHTDIRLIHSRFRPFERAAWRGEFLNRDACGEGVDRIIVATQVVEAGVDISADLLVTELAPWSSLVQRFGRCARWGGEAGVVVVDLEPKDDKAAAPYTKDEIDASRDTLGLLSDVSPRSLEDFESKNIALLPRLYPYEPQHLLLRHELNELFDTTPDLTGADIDISRFIRSGDERDLSVFWEQVPSKDSPPPGTEPSREALCSVPFLAARDWLCGAGKKGKEPRKLKKGMRAWVWDWLDGEWKVAERTDLYPGQTVLVAADCGGYSDIEGWSPGSVDPVAPVRPATLTPEDSADSRQEDESTSAAAWQTIAVHGRETGREAESIARALIPEKAKLFELAGRWHDAGKAHPAFQNSIASAARPDRQDLAKAPPDAWVSKNKLYPMNDGKRRAGFRHEIASALALFSVLQRNAVDHPALLGPWRGLLEEIGMQPRLKSSQSGEINLVEKEIVDLSSEDFDLLAYLICAHHGKVRVSLHGSPADQENPEGGLRIRGLVNGDRIPSLILSTGKDSYEEVPSFDIDLSPASAGLNPSTGAGWTERSLGLIEKYGVFSLAWLEAIMRAADQRASRKTVRDDLLEQGRRP